VQKNFPSQELSNNDEDNAHQTTNNSSHIATLNSNTNWNDSLQWMSTLAAKAGISLSGLTRPQESKTTEAHTPEQIEYEQNGDELQQGESPDGEEQMQEEGDPQVIPGEHIVDGFLPGDVSPKFTAASGGFKRRRTDGDDEGSHKKMRLHPG